MERISNRILALFGISDRWEEPVTPLKREQQRLNTCVAKHLSAQSEAVSRCEELAGEIHPGVTGQSTSIIFLGMTSKLILFSGYRRQDSAAAPPAAASPETKRGDERSAASAGLIGPEPAYFDQTGVSVETAFCLAAQI
ncbi:none [Leptomonas seymouri]|uniref:None n=1 Tax=Leptomonas seymouri TaxID=5684 RepID=A0A0N1I4E3_LEPSE|nr:none [Leptomonas seymouri]|eukprot:KPI85201.1 none [Leptomonas seymouri]